MSKLIISLSGSWVLSHRDDDILPVDYLIKIVNEQFEGKLSVEESGFTGLVLAVSGDVSTEGIILEIRKLFSTHYSIEDDNNILLIKEEKSDDSKAEKNDSEGKSESAEPEADDNDSDEEIDKSAIESSLEEIDKLVGADEYKDLAHEIADIAPEIIKNKTFDILSYQSYIFSINDGYGLTTYLYSFAKLVRSLGIPDIAKIEGVYERALPAPKGESDDLYDAVEDLFRYSKFGSVKILCLDISEWISKTNSRPFKKLLSELSRHMNEVIMVFRVPFVDKEVLNQLRISLNDLMFVRTVSFPPFDQGELQACAAAELEKYGFTISDEAWQGFHGRIAEEKRDGKFYGINTVKKVVRELLYKKQLSNVRSGNGNSHIGFDDASEICVSLCDSNISGYEMLDRMIGGEIFKSKINEIIAQIEFARSNPEVKAPCIHMRFVGNPGTGKTTVARIVGKILKEKGILRVGNFFELSGRDLCGRFVGETAPKTAAICRDAYGSVLFIDEAYSLYRGPNNDKDYGREALETLIAEMENHRTDLVVIMAGYTDDMNTLMDGNAGLASRMPYVIDFPNFTREQLYDIYVSMLKHPFKYDESMLGRVKEYFMSIPDEIINSKEFSNARFVRNLFERTWAKASMRCQLEKLGEIVLTKDDFERSVSDREFCFTVEKKSKIGFVN